MEQCQQGDREQNESVRDEVRKIGNNDKQIEQNNPGSVHFILVFPPVAECKEKEWHTDGEIVEAHEKEIIVDKGKTEYHERMPSALNSLKKISDCKRKQDDIETQKYFLSDEGWEDEHQHR